MNYWVVKGKPQRNRFDLSMIPGKIERWVTGSPPKQWETSDRLFFWESSPSKCLVGLGLLTDTAAGYSANDHTLFKVKYLTHRVESPLGLEELRSIPALVGASFLKAGPAATVLRLDNEMAIVLYRLFANRNPKLAKIWPDLGAVTVEQPQPEEPYESIGAGYGDSDSNKLVESASIEFVAEYYYREGFNVESVERKNCGYDLLCKSNRKEYHVEVKGVSGKAENVILTSNEVSQAKKDDRWRLAIVVEALLKPKLSIYTWSEATSQFDQKPIAFQFNKSSASRKSTSSLPVRKHR